MRGRCGVAMAAAMRGRCGVAMAAATANETRGSRALLHGGARVARVQRRRHSPGAEPPKMSAELPKATAVCAHRGDGRTGLSSACISGSSSEACTHIHPDVVVSKAHASLRKVVSPCRPPNMSSCVPTAVSVADCRREGSGVSTVMCRHAAAGSVQCLSSTHLSIARDEACQVGS